MLQQETKLILQNCRDHFSVLTVLFNMESIIEYRGKTYIQDSNGTNEMNFRVVIFFSFFVKLY